MIKNCHYPRAPFPMYYSISPESVMNGMDMAPFHKMLPISIVPEEERASVSILKASEKRSIRTEVKLRKKKLYREVTNYFNMNV